MSKMKELIVIVLCAVALPPLVCSVESSQEVPITTERHTQQNPAIYGDIVIWEDNRNGNYDIYGYNLTTQNEFQITEDSEDQKNPAIYSNIIIWEDYRHGKPALYGYNLETGEEFQVVPPGRNAHPAIYKDIVVWEDDSIGSPGICGLNLATGGTFQVSETPDEQRWPAVYENYVVWEDERNHHDIIYGYNLETKEEFQVSRIQQLSFSGTSHHNPAIHNNIVVWTDNYDILYGYNLKTTKEFKIAATSMDECTDSTKGRDHNPAIYNNIVVWTDCRNGNPDIYGFNLTTDQEFQITTNKYCQNDPVIYNNYVVWQDNQNGNWDIYGADISSPRTTLFNSRTKLVLFDFLYVFLVVAPTTGVIFTAGRGIWHVKKALLKIPGARDFKRGNCSSEAPMVYIAYLPLYILFIFTQYVWLLELTVLLVCTILTATILWCKKTPYIRITNDNIVVFSTMILKPKVVEVDTIEDIDFSVEDKIFLLLKNGKKVKIKFSLVHADEDLLLIKALKKFKES